MHSNKEFLTLPTTRNFQWPNLTQVKTPCYVYDLQLLNATLSSLKTAAGKHGIKVFYALKANNTDAILQRIVEAGLGADCVSGPEVNKALSAGFDARQIVLAGVGKTDDEIQLAMDADIASLNVESLEELQVIAEMARSQSKTVSISLRINPDIEAHTHSYISTGTEGDKFGLATSELNLAIDILRSEKQLRFSGIHAHVGSQITKMDVYSELCSVMNHLNIWFSSLGFQPSHINLGGGLGIDYHSPDQSPIADFDSYFALLRKQSKLLPGQEIWCELGRSIVAQCGSLLTKVLYTKNRDNNNFLIVDAGMTELIRPALYEAHHHIQNLSRPDQPLTQVYDVAGPICESSDFLGRRVQLPETHRGDLLAIRSTGAYGETMASSYNLRKKAAVYFME